ncbi:MAG: L-lactate dehydrogenase [Parvicellaceae bacterium]|jgi:L-lactate dehydrogenase
MKNVTVIGFGCVGSSLSLLLLNNKHSIRLNVMEPNPECEGAFLDLAHGIPLFSEKELHVNDEELFRNADFIYYTAGIPNAKGGSRLSTAEQNIQLTKEIFEQRVFVNTPYIIVITNPVDIISHSVYQYSGLPQDHVIGTGTFLDSIRLAYYLSRISDLEASDFDTTVLGEHGDSLVPIYSKCKIKGQPLLDCDQFSMKDLEKARICTMNAALQIRETQVGTTYGVSKCAEVLLDYLLESKEHSITLSMRTDTHYRSILSLDHDIYISMPVNIKNGIITVNDEIDLLEVELNAYRESARILAGIVS